MKYKISLFLVMIFVVSTAFSQTVVFNEDFESGPYDLTASGTPTWSLNSRVKVSGTYSDSCYVGLSSTSYLTSNTFSTLGNSSVMLEFKQICKIEFFDAAQVEYSIDGGSTWTVIVATYYLGSGGYASSKFTEQSYSADWQAGVAAVIPTNTWWKTEQFDLGAVIGNQANVKIRFKLTDGNNNGSNQRVGWFLDDIKVTMAPSELVPPAISLVPTIYQDTVHFTGPFQIKAAITDASGIDTAKLIYSINGGPNDTLGMTILLADTFAATIPTQAYNTHIDYSIVATDGSLAANIGTNSGNWFFVQQPAPVVIIGTGTSTDNMTPVNGWFNYSWSEQIYSPSEIGMSGMIDSIFFDVSSVTAPYNMLNQRIYISTSAVSDFSSSNLPDTTTMTRIYSGTYSFNASGWTKIPLTTPYFYNGSGNLHIVWINMDGSYTSGYPNFYHTTTSNNQTQHNYQDMSFPTGAGNLTTSRPNLKIAFQINNNTYDAMMYQITEPATTPIPITGTPYTVKAVFRNVGSDTLTSLTVNWSVDGVLQTTYPWTGSLLQDQNSAELTLGTATFVGQGNHQIKVWTSLPNGVADEGPINDTLVKNYYACNNVLAGTYTIDPVTPTGGNNFQYFADVISALSYCGISDTTVFNIASGTYDTLLNIPVIPGAGPTANVTFQSATGSASDVLIRNNATNSTDNYVFNLAGTDYFGIRNIGIQAIGSSYARCIVLNNGCKKILIEGNTITGASATFQDESLDLINSTYSVDSSVVIHNNILNNGSTAINLIADYSTYGHDIAITGNSITDYYYSGINIGYQLGITIDTNVVNSDATYNYSYGIYISYSENVDIIMNKIHNQQYTSLYVDNVFNTSSDRGNIINNFISVGGSGDAFGISLYSSTFFNVYHNSVNCTSSSTYGYAFYSSYCDSNLVYNNILANNGNGYSISFNYSTDSSDYNNLYSTGSILGSFDWSDYSDLTAWQGATFMDINSVTMHPHFISNSNLHTLAFGMNDLGNGVGVSADIDGDIRNLITPDMGADEFTPAQQEAGIVSFLSPVDGCNLGVESVEIRIACNGLDTIDGNLTAYYSIDGGAPISQAIPTQILPGDTLNFTFSTQANLSVTTTDHIFQISTWISLVGDPVQANDTLDFAIASMHNPAAVTVSNATIPYGTAAILTGICPDTVQWYADSTLVSLLETGASFTTPILYDTTIYFAASTSGVKYNYTFESDLQGWTANASCSGYTTFNWDWSSDAGAGTAFMVNSSTTSGAMLTSPVLNVFGTDITLTFTHRFETESCCDNGYVVYRLDGGAWNQFEPTTGNYNANGGLSVDPAMGSCAYNVPSEGTFAGTSSYMTSSGQIPLAGGTQLEIAFVFSSDGSISYDGWYIDEVTIEKPGCPGQVVPDTVFVTGIPAVDVGVIAIDQPSSGIELTNSEDVTIRVKNYGTSVASNIPVNYSINSGAAVIETIAGPVNPGDTASYTFTLPANLSVFATYELAAYTTLSGDLYPVNDTAKKQVVNSPMVYCGSYAIYSDDDDIGNVTLGNLNNTSPTPYGETYTDYTSVTPAYLALGQTYPVSVTVVSTGSSYSGYCEIYIDYNHDGVFTEPEEIAFGSAYTSLPQTMTGNITIPLTAASGTTGMRVVAQEGGDATSVVPCGTYYYGETEDYLVTLAPQIPDDAGVVSIDEPEFIQSQNSQISVKVTVKNYGTNTLTTIPVEYIANGGAPVSFTWTGSLAPNATTQITLPDVTVLPDNNEICANTLVVNDTNTFNDESCTQFYGLPPFTMFEDDMENGTLLYTDAPTLWQHGKPTASVINIAHSPDSVWATVLAGNYPNSASGYIYTPSISFFGINDAYLTFYYWINAEENLDGGYVQYSINNGTTWASLGDINDPNGYNWFDSYATATPGWTKNTGGWTPAFIKLTAVAGYSTVKFRFGFKSNTATTYNGFAVDDIKILAPAVAIDAGVLDVITPTGTTQPGVQNTVLVRIKNFGTDTLHSIPLAYRLNTGYPPQNGTWTGTLLPDSTATFTFTQTYPGPAVDYTLCAYTLLSGDPYKINDTTCVDLTLVGIEDITQNSVVLMQNNPNPTSAQTEISFTLPEPGKCVITLRNTIGEQILSTQLSGQTGKNTFNFDASNLEQGIYFYTLEFKDVVLTRRLSVIR